MTKKLLIIAPMLLLLVAVVSLLIVINIETNKKITTQVAGYATEVEWRQEIEKCIPKIPKPSARLYAEAGALECLENIMVQAYVSKQVEIMSPALQSVVDSDINLYMICHPASHTAGLKSLEFNNNVIELLDSAAKSTVCDWGMGHGILDALAETKPSIETFIEVETWCNKQIEDQRLYSLCVDGLGHVAWGGTSSFKEAVKWCEKIRDKEGRTMCGGGIVMQKYAPASGKNAEKPADLHKDLVKLCSEWENYVSAEGALNGCFSGASYMYGTELVGIINKWWNLPNKEQLEKMPEEIENAIYEKFVENIEKCQEYKNDTESICEKSLPNQIPIRLTLENKEVHAKMCEFLTEEGAIDNCARTLNRKTE